LINLKETDLFPPVKNWLEERGFEVYSEVQPASYDKRADVVGVHESIVAVVEMKTHLSLALMDQAVSWLGRAHYVYVAVPVQSGKGVGEYAERVARREGIGLLEIKRPCLDYVRCHIKPKFYRRISVNWQDILLPEHQEIAGGHSGGGYITQYRMMMRRVEHVLKYAGFAQQGATIEELLEHCETYYAQPKPTLAAALRNNECGWCESFIGEDGKRRYRIKK
jgi:hypothetical protein